MLLIVATALAGGIELPDFEGDAPTTPLEQFRADRLHCVQLKERYDVTRYDPGVYVEGLGMVGGYSYDAGYDVLNAHWAVARGDDLGVSIQEFAGLVGDDEKLRQVAARRAGFTGVGVALIAAGVTGVALAFDAEGIDTATYLALGGAVIGTTGGVLIGTRPGLADGAHEHYDQQEAGGWALAFNQQLQQDLGLSDDEVARFDVACGGVRTGSLKLPDTPVR